MGPNQRENLTRGIYLVANRQSEEECRSLIYSIRKFGCRLPIRVVPYGGQSLRLDSSWEDVRLMSMSDFSQEGLEFLEELHRRIPQCPQGLLRRFLGWFGEFDEFLYSDNDVVALMNWEELFNYLNNCDFVHADTEFTTKGKFNFLQPGRFEELMGAGALDQAITAGHFLCRPKPQHKADFLAGIAWMEAHPDVPIWHDQTLLHVTATLANWQVLNLCKPPNNWADPFAGCYENLLDLFQVIRGGHHPISHLHYAGGIASGAQPRDELFYSRFSARQRKRRLLRALIWDLSGLRLMQDLTRRAIRKAKRVALGSK